MKFCVPIPKRIGHCFSYFLVPMTMSRAVNYGCFWLAGFFPFQNMYTNKGMHKRKEKNSTEMQTETLETVIKTSAYLYYSSYFFQGLENITCSSYKCHCVFLQTLMSTLCTDCLQPFLHQKRWNFHQTEAQSLRFVNRSSSWRLLPLDVWERSEWRWTEWARVVSRPDVC